MPRYYFNYRFEGRLKQDLDGSDHPDNKSAMKEAEAAARELLASKVLKGELVDGDAFEVTTSDGQLVGTLPLKSVLKLK